MTMMMNNPYGGFGGGNYGGMFRNSVMGDPGIFQGAGIGMQPSQPWGGNPFGGMGGGGFQPTVGVPTTAQPQGVNPPGFNKGESWSDITGPQWGMIIANAVGGIGSSVLNQRNIDREFDESVRRYEEEQEREKRRWQTFASSWNNASNRSGVGMSRTG